MRSRLVAISLVVCSIAAFAPASALPAPEVRTVPCDATDPAHCLLPFPNDIFTVADPDTDTGRRVAFLPAEMPRSVAGKPIDPTEWNRNDGFSPGSMVLTFVPGLDLHRTWATQGISTGGAVDPADHISQISRYLAADAPIVVLDAETGQRHPFWSELDENAQTKDNERLLIVRPATNFLEGRRYVVALRNMRDGAGNEIAAGPLFAAYRDETLPADVARRAHYETKIFPVLEDAGIARDPSLFLAWDFTIASERNLSERVLHMRDTTLALIGDTTPAAGIDGSAPSFTIASVTNESSPSDPRRFLRIDGTVRVPNFLDGPPDPQGGESIAVPVPNPVGSSLPNQALGGRRLLYGLDGKPMQNPVFPTIDVPFICTVPAAAKTSPAHPLIYGHGLLGDRSESRGGSTDRDRERNFMPCATKWMGFANYDVANALLTLTDPSNMPTMADRAQQGFINFIVLQRALRHPQGFASHAAFRFNGEPLFDTRELYYDGNSQGGIMGGALCALSVDLQRCVLGVVGMNYSTLLNRSVDWEGPIVNPEDPDLPSYSSFLYAMFPDKKEQQVVIGLLQMLWDRAEANGYAQHMSDDPLPNTPPHQVLLHVAYGDYQVANVSAEVEARTIGARALQASFPARHWSLEPTFGMAPFDVVEGQIQPWSGSAIVYWDSGNFSPPNANIPPAEAGGDPHEDPRRDVNAGDQKATFWLTGRIEHVAGNYQNCARFPTPRDPAQDMTYCGGPYTD